MGVCDTGGPRSNLPLEESTFVDSEKSLSYSFGSIQSSRSLCLCPPPSLPTLTAHLNGLFAAPYLSSPSERTQRRTSPRRAQ